MQLSEHNIYKKKQNIVMDQPAQAAMHMFTWAIAQTLEEEPGRGVYYESAGNPSKIFSLT